MMAILPSKQSPTGIGMLESVEFVALRLFLRVEMGIVKTALH